MRKLSYDEVARCNKCGFCLPNCPIYKIEGKESAAPRGRNAITRFVIEGKLELSPEIEKSIFSCLGCGACTAACLPKVETKELIFRDRECFVGEGFYPKVADRLAKTLDREHNISDDDNEERGEWQELIKNLPEHAFEKEHAEVIFFVGCVASFFPMVQKIPVNMALIMEQGGVDFTILRGDLSALDQFVEQLGRMVKFCICFIKMFPSVVTGRTGKHNRFGTDLFHLFQIVCHKDLHFIRHTGAEQGKTTAPFLTPKDGEIHTSLFHNEGHIYRDLLNHGRTDHP